MESWRDRGAGRLGGMIRGPQEQSGGEEAGDVHASN